MQTANQKAVELLKNSPYKDKLGTAALFLKQLDAESKHLPALINPHLGNGVTLGSAAGGSGPALQPDKIDQISALPIGARVKLDPWSDHVELLKAKPVALLSAREKMPFEVTPFMPFLTRYQKPGSGVIGRSGKGGSGEEGAAAAAATAIARFQSSIILRDARRRTRSRRAFLLSCRILRGTARAPAHIPPKLFPIHARMSETQGAMPRQSLLEYFRADSRPANEIGGRLAARLSHDPVVVRATC